MAEKSAPAALASPAFTPPPGMAPRSPKAKRCASSTADTTFLKRRSAAISRWSRLEADWYGNVVHRHTAQNFNLLMATAGRITVVEVEEIVPPGELPPPPSIPGDLCRPADRRAIRKTY
ncbi:CoA-transferase [Klebsiella pneumoniae]